MYIGKYTNPMDPMGNAIDTPSPGDIFNLLAHGN